MEEVPKVTQGINKNPLEPGYTSVTEWIWEQHLARWQKQINQAKKQVGEEEDAALCQAASDCNPTSAPTATALFCRTPVNLQTIWLHLVVSARSQHQEGKNLGAKCAHHMQAIILDRDAICCL